MLTGSELMKRAQLAEIERLKKITELANQTRRNGSPTGRLSAWVSQPGIQWAI